MTTRVVEAVLVMRAIEAAMRKKVEMGKDGGQGKGGDTAGDAVGVTGGTGERMMDGYDHQQASGRGLAAGIGRLGRGSGEPAQGSDEFYEGAHLN